MSPRPVRPLRPVRCGRSVRSSRPVPRLAAAVLVLGAAASWLGATSAAAQDFGTMPVTGRVVWSDPADPGSLETIPCCVVTIELRTDEGGVIDVRSVVSDADGVFRADMDCSTFAPPYVVSASADCCIASTQRENTECGPIDLGDLECEGEPVTGETSLAGSVACRNGLFLDPVADCGVLISRLFPTELDPIAFTWTDAAGEWDACVSCVDTDGDGELGPDEYVVEAQCCGETTTLMTELCPRRESVEQLVCDDCPVPPCPEPRDVRLSGEVRCIDGDPVEGCAVQVSAFACGGGDVREQVIATTDADGVWTACLDCQAEDGCEDWVVTVENLCCGGFVTETLVGCAPETEIATLTCDFGGCTPVDPACDPMAEKEVTGRVTCTDPVTGDRVGLGGRTVTVEGMPCDTDIDGDGRCDEPCPTRETTTAPDGSYRVCLPCGECESVVVRSEGCGPATAPLSPDCGSTTVVDDVDCGECIDTIDPCGTDGQEIFGRVTCVDPASGSDVPLAGCDVRVSCPGTMLSETVRTNAGGEYAACLPCGACPDVLVEALCCGRSTSVPGDGCDRQRADIACSGCDRIDAPCVGPADAFLASGRVECRQGGDPTPLAGCDVVLEGRDASGAVLDTVTATTDGDGRYATCFECGDFFDVVADAACCAGSSTTVLDDPCPLEAALETVECADCSPCPSGMTRVQGRVHCRGGGHVADCPVEIVVPTCSGDRIFEVTTDSEGKYRLCVPCPCPGEAVRATALCCPATRSVSVDSCGPITPVPTLFCNGPCPGSP